ncbi:MAG TPA: DUF1013 domain-containing protein [Rhodospirillaceae bacterium]|nr:MAG: cytoplasmic protein [Alphaproteobacteria bacterium GWF2_58_20]HAU29344.1 DUF1013 domain-containing protein [Rhodospirillaceae bacterium]
MSQTNLPLMPKATAVWLVSNTALTFEQIAAFTGMHILEIQGIADGEVAQGIVGLDPMTSGQLTRDEITRCEGNPVARLMLTKPEVPVSAFRTKGPRYTPVAKRGAKPDAVAFFLKNYPELMDTQIAKLIGTTKETIAKVRDKSHSNTANIKPRDPVTLGLCKQTELDAALAVARKAKSDADIANQILTSAE